ncbi:MAG: Tim44-like domain-containing protein [Mariprofundaceae bacterium]
MKTFLSILMLALFSFFAAPIDSAQAKRFGGGGSFGKSFNQHRAAPAPRMSQKNQAAPSKQQGKGSAARGGMMGMLGGLALGGLLGAMFFGGGFEGINFFDILIFAGIGFAIFWFMRRKMQSSQPYAYAGPQVENSNNLDEFTNAEATVQANHAIRPDIDHEHFTSAAKDIYLRMQASWDQKNMTDIRSFCNREVADIIEDDLAKLGQNQNRTEVGMLNAEIADTWIESDLEWVAVHFSAMLKEETIDQAGKSLENNSHSANETWIFSHDPKSSDPTWHVAGIQQAS